MGAARRSARFEQKVKAAAATVASQAPVPFVGGRELGPTALSPRARPGRARNADGARARCVPAADARQPVARRQGRRRRRRNRPTRSNLPETFFVHGFSLRPPVRRRRLQLPAAARGGAARRIRQAHSVRDVTECPPARWSRPATPDADAVDDDTSYVGLEDLGYPRQPPATHLCYHDRRRSAGGGRPDARLHLVGRRRELADAGVHELWRRPRRLGNRRRTAAVLRPQLPRRHAVGAAITPNELMPIILGLQEEQFAVLPPGGRVTRTLASRRTRSVARARPVEVLSPAGHGARLGIHASRANRLPTRAAWCGRIATRWRR